jgi:hypothetical protein
VHHLLSQYKHCLHFLFPPAIQVEGKELIRLPMMIELSRRPKM